VSYRKISIFLAITLLAALGAGGSDFWRSKDWKQWSKGDCDALLLESPWSHPWRYRAEPIDPDLGHELLDQLYFSVQLRSALPVWRAIVRQLELDQKYDRMNDTQRNAFDAKAGPILNRSYGDIILVHVDFSRSNGSDSLQGAVRLEIAAGDFAPALVTEDGTQVSPIRVDISEKDTHVFDLIFPRMKDGVPFIKDGQKQFSVQFQSPQILYFRDIHISPRRVKVDFDLSKMIVDGKLNY
jgi:hypothetical protein